MRPSSLWFAALVALLAASAAHAGPRFEVGLGATLASSDGPKQEGASAALSALWDFPPMLEFGPMLFADDLGTTIGRLLDPNDGVDLGAVALTHRYTFGGAWRVDVPLIRRETWRGQVGATWGYYRIQDDRLGIVQRAISATGWSLGAGLSRAVRPTMSFGLSVRWHQLLEDRQDHYVRASVDLAWLPSDGEASRAPGKATSGSEN
jgi:hypothetical protein